MSNHHDPSDTFDIETADPMGGNDPDRAEFDAAMARARVIHDTAGDPDDDGRDMLDPEPVKVLPRFRSITMTERLDRMVARGEITEQQAADELADHMEGN